MGQIPLINLDRSPAGQLDVAEALLDAPQRPFLQHDAVIYHQAKERQGTHAVKTRSMVSGSTRKLYRQKGTGSARAGDRKPPQRRGGGIAHGPKVRSHAIGMNKLNRKQALLGALADKIREGGLVALASLAPETHKTKAMAQLLKGLDAERALIVTHEIGDNLRRATRNLPDVRVIHYRQLNVVHLLAYPRALVTREALLALQERLTA